MNPWRGLRGLPPEVWLIFSATLVNRAGTMVLPFLALYLTEGRGYPPGLAGFALTVYGVGGLISAPLAGRLSDRLGALRVMQISLVLSGLILLAVPQADPLPAVFGLILIWAITSEAVRLASLAALAGAAPGPQRQAAIALNRLAINLGMSLGPAFGGLLATVSYTLLFVIDGVTSIAAALVLTAWFPRRSIAPDVASDDATPRPGIAVLRNRQMLIFILGLFLATMTFFQMEAALPLYVVRDLGLRPSFIGLIFLVNTVLIILVEVPLNLATARWRAHHTNALGALLIAVGFGALAFATGPVTVALTVVVWTFGEMILLPASATYVADLAPANRRGEYMAAYFVAFGLGLAIGPWAGTLFMGRYGGPALWGAAFGCAACGAAVMSLTARRRDAADSVGHRL